MRISAVRRSIAEHMVRSKATSPHAWTLIEVDVSELVKYREAEKEGFRARHGFPLTYLPFVAQILCEARRTGSDIGHRGFGSSWGPVRSAHGLQSGGSRTRR